MGSDLEKKTGFTISEVLGEELSTHRFGFLTGPMRLEDVMAERPTSALCATNLSELHHIVESCLAGPRFRVYRSRDLLGAEIASVYRRGIAFCAGISFELGESVQAILFTRGMREASRMIEFLGGDPRSAVGLAGSSNLFLDIRGKGSFEFQLGRVLSKKEKGSKNFLKKNKSKIEGF